VNLWQNSQKPEVRCPEPQTSCSTRTHINQAESASNRSNTWSTDLMFRKLLNYRCCTVSFHPNALLPLAGSAPRYLFTVTEERIMGFSKWIRAAAITWQFWIPSVLILVFPKILLADTFWLRKITTDPHILAHVNSVWNDTYPELKILCLRTEVRLLWTHSSSRCKKCFAWFNLN